jgi:hypothetical protein
MRINRRDLGFMAIVGIIVVILMVNSGRERPGKVPSDKRHRPFLNALADGKGREEVEKGCPTCHNAGAIPLPKKHPPKEQCLLCHAG